ncbi:MAG TPA: VCBS repeat-containing protein [Gemmataceae bacterium]|jgi:hypothetical protein
MSPWRPQGGPAARRLAVRPQLLPLEDRAVPSTTTTADPSADTTTTTTTGDTTTTPAVKKVYAAGADAGSPPLVRVYNPDGTLKYQFLAYGSSFRGGVRVAVGDVTGDGTPDIVTAPGAGAPPLVKVFDGASGAEVGSYMAYTEAFRGGVYVAVADVTGDGKADILTGADAGGGPHVKVMDAIAVVPPVNAPASTFPNGVVTEFFAYDALFRGGVRVAAADVNGDGRADIITAAGPGGGPHVKVINGATGELMYEFFAFASTYTGGVYVTAGDIDGDGKAEVVAGSGGLGQGQVKVYDDNGSLLRTYSVTDPRTNAPVRVAVADIDNDGKVDLFTAVGAQVQVRDPLTNATKKTFAPFDSSMLGGVFVG